MGVQGLMGLLDSEFPDPDATRNGPVRRLVYKSYRRNVAIDGHLFVQALLYVKHGPGAKVTNDRGETTWHLQGTMKRVLEMLEAGIFPIFVFRREFVTATRGRRTEDVAALAAATDANDGKKIDSIARRALSVTSEQIEECKELLRLMGLPVIESPGDPLAQCAELANKGVVHATATEDMRALAFNSPFVLRNLTRSQADNTKKEPLIEINLKEVLKGWGLTLEEFVDLCILCGCHNCPSPVEKIKPKTGACVLRSFRRSCSDAHQPTFPPSSHPTPTQPCH